MTADREPDPGPPKPGGPTHPGNPRPGGPPPPKQYAAALTAEQRMDVYSRQTGRSEPTSRQARRIRHKSNRELRTS